MARQVKVHDTSDGRRYRVRYRLGGQETSETFLRQSDAETFRDILGRGQPDRVADALAWLHGKQDEAGAATFGDWFETWAGQLTGITEGTRAGYHSLHRRYLTDLDPLPLTLVSRAHIAGLVNRMDREGLAPKTIKNAIHMLSATLGVALDDGLITRNPVRRVRLPSRRFADEDEVEFLSHQQAGRIIAATAPHYRPLVTFMFGTGLRWSEVTAVQGRHVDLDAGTVRVERAWKKVPGGWEMGVPKSAKSRRTVNAAVAALYAAHSVMRGPTDLVFTTPLGNPVRHGNFFNRVWKPALDAAGWPPSPGPRPTIHDCRATHGSWLISDGIGLEAVQDQLGHESYETTRRLYAHLLPAVGVAAGKAASEALARALATVDGVEFGPRALEPGSGAD